MEGKSEEILLVTT